MPTPINPHISYGQKLISLFARLLFTQKEYSLIDLSRIMDCSKQTVIRLIEDIQLSYGVEIEDRIQEKRKYYKLKQTIGIRPVLQLSKSEVVTLQMCMSFAEHLLGDQLFAEAVQVLENSSTLLTDKKGDFSSFFANFHTGHIDYTPHKNTIRLLIGAMEEKKICEITYQKITNRKPKTFLIEPLKIFSHQDTIYLHVRRSNSTEETSYFLLAIHRIQTIRITDIEYEYPKNYDFDQFFNSNFGVIKGDPFPVTIEFKEFAAAYAAERTWNSETRKEWIDDDTLVLSFEVSSQSELIGWVLSWAGRAKVLEPDWLAEEIRDTILDMVRVES